MTMNKDYDILIVDDEEVVIDSIKKICTFMNYSVITAESSTAAIDILNEKSIRLIVADIMMPEISGFDFLNEIIKRNIQTPVILTSGNASLDTIHKSFLLGAIDFLPKPFTFDELECFIERGLLVAELLEKKKNNQSISNTITYVSCPSNYQKFGKWNWMSLENNFARIGVSDFLLKTLKSFNGINFKECGDTLSIAEKFIEIIDSKNLVHQIISPVSGIIQEVNEKVLSDYSLLEKDPYFEGWIYKVKCSDFTYESKYLLTCTSE